MNKIICGDIIEELQKLESNSIDLVCSSPPYNLSLEYDNYSDNLEWNEYFKWCKQWLIELYRVLKDDGRICINHYLSFGKSKKRLAPISELYQIMNEIGYNHHAVIVWEDRSLAKRTAWGSYLSASAPYCSSPHEGILINYKNQWKKQNKGISDITKEEFIELTSGVWKLGTTRSKDHPAPFPEALPYKCIKLLSYVGDTILDPFNGIGTTCIAAKKLNRKYIGIDNSKKYCDIAEKKLSKTSIEEKPISD